MELFNQSDFDRVFKDAPPNVDVPGCYGEYRTGNIQAERDCDSCMMQLACMSNTKEKHSA